ncbi:MAG: hypothetical protein ACK4M1_10805 [Flavobacterium sp.]
MKLKFILLTLIIIVTGCACKNTSNINELELVSMMQLINTPEKYDGKKIEIRGYFIIAFEESVIYLNKTDYDIANTKNGIWLSVSKEFMKSQNIELPYKGYICIDGIFIKNKKNSTSSYSGTLKDIDYVSRIVSREENVNVSD